MPIGPGIDRHRSVHAASILAVIGTLLLLPVRHAHAQEPVPRRPLGQHLPVYTPPPGDPERREVSQIQNPTGTIALRDAVGLALLQSPSLAAFAWETRAREARVIQSGRPPNPGVSVLVEDVGARQFTGGGLNEPVQPQTTIQLSQLVEMGGKRAARQRVATLNRDLAAWDYEAARIDVLTDVARTFTDVLSAQEVLAHIQQTTRLVEQVHETASVRVAAGVVSPIEETRAAVALGSVRVELARARRTLDASRARLGLLWGSPTPAFTAVEGHLRVVLPALPSYAALALRLQGNPELARWSTELLQREAAVALERSKGVPDISVAAGYRRFTNVDTHALVVGASLSLPVFDRNRAGLLEAQSRAAKASEDKRAAEARVMAALADAYAALASAYDEVTVLRTAVLPGSQQAFEAVSEGYRLGRFGYLDVLESQRTLITASGQHLRALSDYHKAVASVERLIGAPLIEGPEPPTAGRE